MKPPWAASRRGLKSCWSASPSPAFSPTPVKVIALARESEVAGIDGVFAFDHLWPGGIAEERPSLSIYPVLGAVAAATSSIRSAPLWPASAWFRIGS